MKTLQRLTALRTAGTGPVPIIDGSTPAWAQDTMRTMGFKPLSFASFPLIITTTAAPSFRPDRPRMH